MQDLGFRFGDKLPTLITWHFRQPPRHVLGHFKAKAKENLRWISSAERVAICQLIFGQPKIASTGRGTL